MKPWIIFLASCVLLISGPVSADDALEIGRDGRFVAFSNGVVTDTRTGLEWIAGPDVDTSYYQAVEWVRGLAVSGGRWRLPTARELGTLYRTPGSLPSITPLLQTRGIHVWPYQADENISLYLFRYMDPYGTRGFAVRSSVRDDHTDATESQQYHQNGPDCLLW